MLVQKLYCFDLGGCFDCMMPNTNGGMKNPVGSLPHGGGFADSAK